MIVTDTSMLTGIAAVLAAFAQALRLSRWRGLAVWKEPLLFAQHAAYAWLVIGLGLLAATSLGDWASSDQAHHALGAGAIGTMTAIVMLRALLGHSGRPIERHAPIRSCSACFIWGPRCASAQAGWTTQPFSTTQAARYGPLA